MDVTSICAGSSSASSLSLFLSILFSVYIALDSIMAAYVILVKTKESTKKINS